MCVCVCVCVREREKERERDGRTDGRTDGDEYRLPYWPITSSLDHTPLSNLQGPTYHFLCFLAGDYSTGGLQWAVVWDAAPAGHPTTPVTTCWDWFKIDSASRGHLHISFHNTHIFPLNHITGSAYFHRESLIDGSVKGQYATYVVGVLLLEAIQFLSKVFLFLAKSKSSCKRFHLFVVWNIHTLIFLPIFVF